MYAVETYELTKAYNRFLFWRSKPAVDSLTMNVPEGKVFGFLGPNGAGKTTTLRMLLGLTHPTGGAARVLGEDITNAAIRSRIGYLAESPAYYDYLKAREFLDYYARIFHMPRPQRKKRIEELLDYVGLAEQASSRLKTFSRGMIQRVGLAQAMLNDPDLLLLDEPMTGLDPLGRRHFKDLIKRVSRDEGKTVFFCSHVLSDAEEICDMIGIISKGRLLVMDKLDSLLKVEGETLEEFFIKTVSESEKEEEKERRRQTMHNILVIAQGTVVRQMRNKVLYLLILVCLCLIGIGSLYRILSLETEAKLMRDLGLAGISLIGMVVAVFIGSNEVGKELREGTLDALLAKPLGRDEFILGKYLGTLFVALINIVIITVGFLLIMSFYEGNLKLDLIRAVVLNVFEVSVLISIAIFFTTFLPEAVSAVITFLIFVMGHGAHMLLLVSERTEPGVPRIAAKALFYLIPNLHHFNIRAAVGHELAIPWSYVGCAIIYGLCYTGMVLCLSVLVFRRREL